MQSLYTSFLYSLLFFASLRILGGLVPIANDEIPKFAEVAKNQLQVTAEGKLATGGKIRIETADIYDLELIPGISDTLATHIESSRQAICATRRHLGEKAGDKPLEVVYGIGVKTAKKLGRYLDSECGGGAPSPSSLAAFQSRALLPPSPSLLVFRAQKE